MPTETQEEIAFSFMPDSENILEEIGYPDYRPVFERGKVIHFVTTDAEWVGKAEEMGGIKRLDLALKNFGITGITIIDGFLKRDKVEYKLDFNPGQSIILPEEQILNYKKFRNKYIAAFQDIPPIIKQKDWEELVRPFLRKALRVTRDEDEIPARLDVINKIENGDVVEEKEKLITGAFNRIWLDRATNTLFVMSKEIKDVADKYKITLRRLHYLLEDYLLGEAKQERIGKKRYQLWRFNPKKFQLKDKTS